MRTYLAVDIGASSGRAYFGWVEDGRIRLEEVYRFPNLKRWWARLLWDIEALLGPYSGGAEGMQGAGQNTRLHGNRHLGGGLRAGGRGRTAVSNGVLPGRRTDALRAEAEKLLPFAWLYGRTGISTSPSIRFTSSWP